jgi:ribosome-binding factor A
MDVIKQHRREQILKELAAEFLELHSNRTALITVTGIEVSPDLHHVTILLSVLPNDKTKSVVDFANRQRGEFSDFLTKRSRIRMLPSIKFVEDLGERNRQKIDELLSEQ